MSRAGGRSRLKLVRTALAGAGIDTAERVATGVDIVGDIAIVRLPELTLREKRRFARALAGEAGNVSAVFEQEGGVEGEHRLRRLGHLFGEKRTLTTHRENGCVFRVDVARCYFSPRLSTERLRIAESVAPGERVLNMFAGVGPFSIEIARKAGARVTSCEINAYACDLHEENNTLNKVGDRVSVVRGDVSDLARPRAKYSRVLMPHPSAADRFLPVALSAAKRGGVIHYYRHVLGEDEGEAAKRIKEELSGTLPPRSRVTVRRVREVGPRWVEMAADIRLP